jgi:hypothetical protein
MDSFILPFGIALSLISLASPTSIGLPPPKRTRDVSEAMSEEDLHQKKLKREEIRHLQLTGPLAEDTRVLSTFYTTYRIRYETFAKLSRVH